jgi:hypothetical protein
MKKSFDPPIGNVDSRFDLFAEDKENRIIVDIQHVRYADHYDRFLHYHCAALLEQVVSSQDYRPGLKVFTIVVLTSGDRQYKRTVSKRDWKHVKLHQNFVKAGEAAIRHTDESQSINSKDIFSFSRVTLR